MPVATAAAEPLEDPPGVCAGLCGFRVLPGARTANSVVTVSPTITAPAARSIATTLASRDGVRPAQSTDPFSVGMSSVSMMSLRPTGTPCRGPTGCPESRSSSAARAWARAWSGSRKAQACTCASVYRTRARHASTSSAELMTPSRSKRAASDTVRQRLPRRVPRQHGLVVDLKDHVAHLEAGLLGGAGLEDPGDRRGRDDGAWARRLSPGVRLAHDEAELRGDALADHRAGHGREPHPDGPAALGTQHRQLTLPVRRRRGDEPLA